MNTKLYLLISGFFFFTVGIMHFIRFTMRIPVQIGDWIAPLWMSAGGFIVPVTLGLFALKLYKKQL